MQADNGALKGVRVLDLSRVLAGPFCTQILGDLAADVIKVERPRQGDDTRHWGPPFTANGTAGYFTCANRNKRSITLDLKSAAGGEIVRRLAATSDILIENYKTGELAALGLGYEALAEINPRLIYCSITGFGQTGPRAGEAGYDFLIQAMGGLMSISGNADDYEGMKAGVAVADLFTGMWAAVAILAALQARTHTNRGQYIDLALFDCQLAMLGNVAANWFLTEKPPRRYGNAHPNIVPYQTFQARDGAFALAVGNDRQFAALCEVFQAEELIARFATNEIRVREREACIRALAEIFHKYPREEIIARCAARAIPAGPINNVAEAFADEQTKAREMIINIKDHPDVPKMIGSPIKFSDTAIAYRYGPPALGEHNDEILAELGFSAEQRAEWRAKNVI